MPNSELKTTYSSRNFTELICNHQVHVEEVCTNVFPKNI
jgi:hypothetical protein